MDSVGSGYRTGLGSLVAVTELDLCLSSPVGPVFRKLLRNSSTMGLSRAFYAARHRVYLNFGTLKKGL